MKENKFLIKSKKQMFLVIGAFALIMLLGTVTYAFFNYTRTGGTNVVKTGRIYFSTTEGTNINLTNAFPITSTQAQTDTTNAQTLSIRVVGDTDYDEGIEYLITADDVHMTIGSGVNAKEVPVAIEVSVTSNNSNSPATTLGTAETGDYYANRSSYSVSKYKVLHQSGSIEEDERLVVGYIAPNTEAHTAEGIDGVINIKAYFDANRIAITDTYDGTESDNIGTTTSWVGDREVFTTTEWNGIHESGNGLTFKVRVESNEGIWVTAPAAAQTAAQQIAALLTETNAGGNKIYTGANPDNYVIFNNEQWRIIGVYDGKLKIVKASPLSETKAYDDSSNVWAGSDLELWLNNEETGYYSTLSQTAKDMIVAGTWNAGATAYDATATTAYANATGTPGSIISRKVGLIATYEYLYAAENDGTCWSTSGYDYDGGCGGQDWLTLSSTLWTLSPRSGYASHALYVFSDGYVNSTSVNITIGVSPAVYLNQAVTITGGKGQSGGNEYTLSYTAS